MRKTRRSGCRGPTLGQLRMNIVSLIPDITVEIARRMLPVCSCAPMSSGIFRSVLNALVGPQLADKPMVLMALATIRAETGSFLPISEGQSRYNTSPGGSPFDLYDSRADLGNLGPPDGERFKGRGFIQLTGRSNYMLHGAAIGLGDQLIDEPDLANDPGIAAESARQLPETSRREDSRGAYGWHDLREARRLVNGGKQRTAGFRGSLPDRSDTGSWGTAPVKAAGSLTVAVHVNATEPRTLVSGFRHDILLTALTRHEILSRGHFRSHTCGTKRPPEAGPFDASRMDMQSPPAQGVAIRAGRLFDSKSGAMLKDQVILIQGDRILAVGATDRVQIPHGTVIDLSRATVLPGLIDRHVHLMQDQQPNDARAAFSGLNYALKDSVFSTI